MKRLPRATISVFTFTLTTSFVMSTFAEWDRDKAVLAEYRIPHGNLPEKHHTHAATLTEAADGTLIAAWFGGTEENAPDVDIWVSRKESGADWSEPVVVEEGMRGMDGERKEYSTWNPVLFTDPQEGTVYLWYKITGTNEEENRGYRNWWGAVKTSKDHGKSWSERIWLPEVSTKDHPIFEPYSGRATGPVKNRPIVLPDGSLFCGSSTETEAFGWRVHFEIYRPGDWTGQKHGVEIVGPLEGRGIQPSFVVLAKDMTHLKAFTRDNGITSSRDGGKTWTSIEKSPVKTSKGFHALTTSDAAHFVVYNETGARTPLKLARSMDGETWEIILPVLREEGSQSMDYPSMMQSKDGKIHVVHTFGRDYINHLVLDTDYLSREEP